MEAESLEEGVHALVAPGPQHAGLHRIARVERHADRHRLAVPQLVGRQRLELVRGPVPIVERPAAAALERSPP